MAGDINNFTTLSALSISGGASAGTVALNSSQLITSGLVSIASNVSLTGSAGSN